MEKRIFGPTTTYKFKGNSAFLIIAYLNVEIDSTTSFGKLAESQEIRYIRVPFSGAIMTNCEYKVSKEGVQCARLLYDWVTEVVGPCRKGCSGLNK